ncbi:MAG: hypothetical protein ACRD1T_20775, partial [Acidimicrobiia bacterium]
PHEVTHTIFATHFGRPLPRWADEGACTTVEHDSEKHKQHRMLYEFLTTGRGIAFNQMFAMTEYPPDVLPLYSQGYSLVRYLIAHGGKQKFVQYVGDGMRMNNWTKATQTHYAFHSLSELQVTWLEWVRRGCPAIAPGATQLASQERDVPSKLASIEENAESPRPDVMTLASRSTPSRTVGGTGTSWYARIRDETAANRRDTSGERQATNPLHDAVSKALTSGPRSSPTPPRVVTRPQPTERAQQRVLE